jgi:zinc/manganese transport system substrate-binding protein
MSDVAAFENDLRMRQVSLLFYNSQATNAAAKRLIGIAQAAKIPIVGVTETEPPATKFQAWMLGQLDAIARALSDGPR